jgi:hypothetical protein
MKSNASNKAAIIKISRLDELITKSNQCLEQCCNHKSMEGHQSSPYFMVVQIT